MTVGERIEALRSQIPNLSQAELARRVGVGQSTMNGLIRGDARSSKHLHRIARELGTTIDYLTGEVADPTEGVAPAPTAEQVAKQLNSVLIPFYEVELSMGGGRVLDDVRPLEHHPFPREWLRARIAGRFDQVMLMAGRGDSMEPTISDGDVLAIDRAQNEVRDQELIWAFSYGDLGMVKRLRRLPGGKFLVLSDNEKVKPFEALADEIALIGRVFWIGRWQ